MKQFIVCFIIATICTSFTIQLTESPNLSLSAAIISRSDKNMSVRITLTNNTSDTINYLGWECSWQNLYSVDNDNWRIIQNQACYQNGHKVFQIPPHQSETKILQLKITVVGSKHKSRQFKIGFHYINPEDEFKIPSAKLAIPKNDESIIWSNEMTTKIFTKPAN